MLRSNIQFQAKFKGTVVIKERVFHKVTAFATLDDNREHF